MKLHISSKRVLIVLMTLFSVNTFAEDCFDCPDKKQCNCYDWGTGIYQPRPQAQFWPAFFNPYLYTCCRPCDRGHSFFAGYRYSESMKNNRIARCLFGADERSFTGSMATFRGENDWLADDFGLAPNFSGKIFFNPSIKNHIFDVSMRLEFGNWNACLDRLYLTMFTSLVYGRWSLGSCEVEQTPFIKDNDKTYSSFPPCYMSTPETFAAKDFATALSGDYIFGDMQTKWRYNKIMLNRTLKSVNFADLHMMLGYDFLQKPWYHVGAFMVAVAPIGNRISPYNVFEPIIGNGHHWELGVGLDTHFNLWHCDEKCLQFFVNGYLTHLFSNNQLRTFDLQPSSFGQSGAGSRFLLLKEFDDTNTYTGNLINALNFTTREIKSSFDLQGEITAQLMLRWCNWSFAAGYNMFGRSSEKIRQAGNPCRQYEGKHFGVKGVSGVCSNEWNPGTGLTGKPCPYHATESQSRMTDTMVKNFDPALIDNAQPQQPAYVNKTCTTWNSPKGTKIEDVQLAYDSLVKQGDIYVPAPIFVGPNASTATITTDLDYKGVPSQITHGFFAHINYEFNDDCRCFQPFLGVGGAIEFVQNGPCKVCGTNQWNIWLKGGINF